jgi:hypothetical protein
MSLLNLLGIQEDLMTDTTKVDTLVDYVDSTASSGQAVVDVGDGSQFTAGEGIILYDGANNYETAVIQSINTNQLTLTANLTNSYPEGSRIGRYLCVIDTDYPGKMIRLGGGDLGDGSDGAFVSSGNETWSTDKNFTSITIQNGHTITVSGNIEIKCQGAVDIQSGGKLSAKGQGHSGGATNRYHGQQGTGYNGAGTNTYTSNYGGGGGSDALSSPSSSNLGGGGGGGYGGSGSNGNTGGDSTANGRAGGSYNDAELSNFTTAYLKGGGGGGGGHYSSSYPGGVGGAGGGIIKLSCLSLNVSGEIDCDGEDGGDASYPSSSASYGAGGGGGGAGGTIFIQCPQLVASGSNLIHANGGSGGNGAWSNAPWSSANGGAGGDGRIRIEAGKVTGTTSPTYASGYASNLGYSRYGFYTTEVNTTNEAITVNCFIRQAETTTDNPTGSVSSGQADVIVSDGSQFSAGDKIIITEDDKTELMTIDSIATNTITMTSDFGNSYTTLATIVRVDYFAKCSLEGANANDEWEDMTLREYASNVSGYWDLTFNKTVKANDTQSGGYRLVGLVIADGGDISRGGLDINADRISWSYY